MGLISFKDYNRTVLNRLKKNSWSRTPISHQVIRGPNFSIARVSNLPIRPYVIKAPSPKCSIVPSRAYFPFPPLDHLASPSFPITLLRVSNSPIASSKGPKFSMAPLRVPNILITSLKWWPVISHHVIKLSQFIIASSRGPRCHLLFPITLSRGPNLLLHHQGRAPISPIASSKGPRPNSTSDRTIALPVQRYTTGQRLTLPRRTATKEPNLSLIFLLSENVENYWNVTTMISVAYRTSLEMFCNVKLHFSQLLKAHVLTVAILGVLFI